MLQWHIKIYLMCIFNVITHFPLPVNKFAFYVFVSFSGVPHLVSLTCWKIKLGKSEKQPGGQCHGGLVFIYFKLD